MTEGVLVPGLGSQPYHGCYKKVLGGGRGSVKMGNTIMWGGIESHMVGQVPIHYINGSLTKTENIDVNNGK